MPPVLFRRLSAGPAQVWQTVRGPGFAAGRSVLGTLLNLFYPPACAGCGAAVRAPGSLCAPCDEAAPRLAPPFCAVCSLPFRGRAEDASGRLTCANCHDREFAFECAVSARRHVGLARELVVRFKYLDHYHVGPALAAWLAEALDDPRLTDPPADALVPVPLHPRRWRERGYNQAEECCRLLGRRAALPVWRVLRRTRYTETQTHLTRDERARNLQGAFALAGGWLGRRRQRRLDGARLLLVDDVFTSGATVDACAHLLREAGAASVRVLTATRR